MPFYFKKSVSAGPFRFNFSKGGVGVSVGVKGLRVGTGPRGHYVHAGLGGFSYRASVGRAGEARARRVNPPGSPDMFHGAGAGVELQEIDSGDVLAMRDEEFADVLDEMNSKQRKVRLATVFCVVASIIAATAATVSLPVGLVLAAGAILSWLLGDWLDSYRRTTVLFYDLGHTQESYQDVVSTFDVLADCAGIWHVEAGGAVQDLVTWKRNSGATHIVKKNPTSLFYKLPAVVKCNITPPAVRVGRQTVYFLPDVALIEDRNSFGAVAYADLRIEWQNSNFIEEGTIPKDAQVVGHTWKHPNKSGGPDRRFKDNYEIPVCRYEVMHLKSASGLNELIEFSRHSVVAPFAGTIRALCDGNAGAEYDRFIVNQSIS